MSVSLTAVQAPLALRNAITAEFLCRYAQFCANVPTCAPTVAPLDLFDRYTDRAALLAPLRCGSTCSGSRGTAPDAQPPVYCCTAAGPCDNAVRRYELEMAAAQDAAARQMEQVTELEINISVEQLIRALQAIRGPHWAGYLARLQGVLQEMGWTGAAAPPRLVTALK